MLAGQMCIFRPSFVPMVPVWKPIPRAGDAKEEMPTAWPTSSTNPPGCVVRSSSPLDAVFLRPRVLAAFSDSSTSLCDKTVLKVTQMQCGEQEGEEVGNGCVLHMWRADTLTCMVKR